jgi:hypothetical protein
MERLRAAGSHDPQRDIMIDWTVGPTDVGGGLTATSVCADKNNSPARNLHVTSAPARARVDRL